MRLWDTLTHLLSRAAPWVTVSGSAREIPPERRMNDFLQAYTYWTYACARTIADTVAEVPFKLFAITSSNKEEQIMAHPALDLLSSVNPWMTEYDLREITMLHLELVGESWWALERGRLGPPQEIWPLMPPYITLNSSSQEFISSIDYKPPGVTPTNYKPDQVIQFKYGHPATLFRGWSPTRAASLPLDIHQYAQEWVRNFFFNDATPAGVLSTDQPLTRDQADGIRMQWEDNHKGRNKSHRVAVLGLGAKYQLVEHSLKDLAFTDEQQRLRDDILGIYGVPKSVLGITDDVNRANAEAGQYVFAQHVIKPRLRRIEQRLNESLIKRFYGDKLILRFDDPVPENRDLRLNEATNSYKAGLISLNEARTMLGNDALPGQNGKVFFVPSGGVLTLPDDFLAEPAPASNPAPAPNDDDEPPANDEEGEPNNDDEDAAAAGKSATNAVTRILDDETVWQRWIHRTEPLERKVRTALKKFFQWQQDGVMERLRKLDGEKLIRQPDFTVDELLWEADSARNELLRRIGPLLGQIIVVAGEGAIADLGLAIAFDVQNYGVQTRLHGLVTKVVGLIDETTRQQLRDSLTEGLAKGESIPQLAERVSQVFSQAKTYRAERIARTETNSAANMGSREAFKQTGVVKATRWVSAIDERTRTSPFNHVAANGEQILLGTDAKYVRTGEALEYPGDYNGSAGNIINCRCTEVPVTFGDDEEEDG